jgi:type II secretory ATPase GspE/PulE/Tfp pilus assembly ATPase PilB-like protein
MYIKLADFLKEGGDRTLAVKFLRKSRELSPANVLATKKINVLYQIISLASKYELLIKEGIVDEKTLEKAIELADSKNKSVEFILEKEFGISKEDLGRALSNYYKCPFKTFDPEVQLPHEMMANLKKTFLLHEHWVPLKWGPDGVEILIDDPSDLRKTGSIRGLIKAQKLKFCVSTREDIEAYIENYYNQQQVPKGSQPLDEMIKSLEFVPELKLEEETEEQISFVDESNSQVVRFVDQMILMAYRERASDIHVEPSFITKKVHVRFRIDGVLKEIVQVPISMSTGIVSRLKIMANLDIAEKRLPQDGKILFKRKGVPAFELRLATLPIVGGLEDAVLRILAKAGAMRLEDMGLTEQNLANLRRIIQQPYGLILVVGPTGSGKTSTLHAILGELNRPGVKVLTAEDPVEITQQGLRQVEVRPKIGLDFARVMRAFLRADPDIIMIGEMRDHETASIAVEASLTGHLVLSTLHTNSAPETVTRLLDMGLNALNFSDAFLGVLAQRLVRRLCPKCKEPYEPAPEEREEIERELSGIWTGDHGSGGQGERGRNMPGIEDLKFYRPRSEKGRQGCDYCAHTGYRGRTAIHELMLGTKEMKKLIRRQAPTDELFTQAKRDGMLTLKQDGLLKVIMGITDFGELRRVVVS